MRKPEFRLPHSETMEEHIRLCAVREYLFGGAFEAAERVLRRLGEIED